MTPDLVSKDELIAAGWKDRQVDAAMDEPDEHGPSGHWLNKSGKPYYYKDRVAVAAYRTGLTERKPTDAQWERWADRIEPTAPPLLTFDFHRLADKGIPNVSNRFWELRLSHPFAGRLPNTEEREILLIDEVMIKLARFTFSVNLMNHADLTRFLAEKAKSASSALGPHWPDNVMVRRARRSSYVSKATSKKSIERFIYAISLIHTGQVRGPRDVHLKFNEFLVEAPKMRFDRRSLEDNLNMI
jgi:hypothetical protein